MKNPLYLHANGQWCKTINGKKCYFGTDREAAVARYLAEKDALYAGRERPQPEGSPTLIELANVFLADRKARVKNGQMGERSLADHITTLTRLVDIRGQDDQPAKWSPPDFADIKEAYFAPVVRTVPIRGGIKGPSVERRAPRSVDGDIARIRCFLKWCQDSELLPAPRYGQSFQKTSAKQRRQAKQASGPRDLRPDEILAVLNKLSVHARPLLLLGINGALGATDLSLMEEDAYQGEWLICPRNKTAMDRKIWLWPETRAAIDSYLAIRKPPYRQDLANRLFRTGHRDEWVRARGDGIGKAFLKARRAAGLERGTFYDLRRTFQTVAEGALDFPAVKFVMGHVPSGDDMSAVYRQVISDDRIRTVCQYVRQWLFPQSPAQPAIPPDEPATGPPTKVSG